MQVKKKQIEAEQTEAAETEQTGSKLGKEYVKGVYCHLANNLHAEYIM